MLAAGEDVNKYNGEDGKTAYEFVEVINTCPYSALELAKNFRNELPEVQLSEPFESVKSNLNEVLKITNEISKELIDELKEALVEALDRQVISNPEQVLNRIIEIENKFEKPSDDLKAAFEKFNGSLKDLLGTFPSVVPEKCVDQMQRHIHVTELTKMFIILFPILWI
jgi:DNA repair ATPase RecN